MTLLCVIYLAFISLGLPDSLLGAAWPTMRLTLGTPVELAGAISMVTAGGTIISSLSSARMIRRFGTARVTLVSAAMTAVSLIGYAVAPSPWLLFLCAIPLGLGGGSVDAALNNYVALHYEAKHMSWLHCFWGIGATMGPMILSACLGGGLDWQAGYWIIIALQLALVGALASAQKMWRRQEGRSAADIGIITREMNNMDVLRMPIARFVLLTFFCYCAAESCLMLWTASFLTEVRGLSAEQGALGASLFYFGMTGGRAVCGFLTARLSSERLIRIGAGVMLLGGVLLLIPDGMINLGAVCLTGLGCAPIYPCTIHETPKRFGEEASQAATGLQMAAAYTGSTFMPLLLGALAAAAGMQIAPAVILALTIMMTIGNEFINRRV